MNVFALHFIIGPTVHSLSGGIPERDESVNCAHNDGIVCKFHKLRVRLEGIGLAAQQVFHTEPFPDFVLELPLPFICDAQIVVCLFSGEALIRSKATERDGKDDEDDDTIGPRGNVWGRPDDPTGPPF